MENRDSSRVRNLRPDAPDLRDRLYQPTLRRLAREMNSEPYKHDKARPHIKDQGDTNACTGFALSSLVERLRSADSTSWQDYSPFMPYYMALRHDNLPGDDNGEGTTARAAMKGWQKHGICPATDWPSPEMQKGTAGKAWISSGFKTPLGAYYRVDHCEISDIHAALNEIGVVFVTAAVHEGWLKPDSHGEILYSPDTPRRGGHAFLLVGYDEHGFWVQNSWGKGWGKDGFARITYGDWRRNAMDAWVAQLGVYVSRHLQKPGLELNTCDVEDTGLSRSNPGSEMLASDPDVRNQQINPYVIALGNNGMLDSSGPFYTGQEDLHDLLSIYLRDQIKRWGLTGLEPIDIAIYAHGGLVDESAGETEALFWIPALLTAQIFPVFLMWETGWFETLVDKVKDLAPGAEGAASANLLEVALDWWDDRFETLVSAPGAVLWDEMKKNAQLASGDPNGGLTLLYNELLKSEYDDLRPRLRLHLIGHSAGAILHAYLLQKLLSTNIEVDGIYFMAPACTINLFTTLILPSFADRVKAYAQFGLTAQAELADNCLPLPYRRSLLYLISNSLEHQQHTPLLGMEIFASQAPAVTTRPPNVQVWDQILSPTNPLPASLEDRSTSTSHGGFDSDPNTRTAILTRIQNRTQASRSSMGNPAVPTGPKPLQVQNKAGCLARLLPWNRA